MSWGRPSILAFVLLALQTDHGLETAQFGSRQFEMTAIFLKPVPITRDNLGVVIDAGWVSKDVVCQGVEAGSVAACN